MGLLFDAALRFEAGLLLITAFAFVAVLLFAREVFALLLAVGRAAGLDAPV